MGVTAVLLVAVLVGGVAVMATWLASAALRRRLESRLANTDAELRRLGDSGLWRERGDAEIRQEMVSFRGVLESLGAREQERRAREEQSWAVLHKVAAVLSGGQRAGRAGENVLRETLAHLPPSMVETDFRVNGKVVEFGLVLPDGRRLPIDSKWSAERELQALAADPDPVERDRLIRVIERTVTERAREVCSYRDPAVTTPVGVAAIPDAAYGVLRRAHSDAYRQGVIVIPYSMALPVVLFLHSLVSRFGMAGDVDACLTDLTRLLDSMESVLENKVARASAMLVNGTEELRGQMGKARTTMARARDFQSVQDEVEPEVARGLLIEVSS
jgi:hypothetical protein